MTRKTTRKKYWYYVLREEKTSKGQKLNCS